MKKKKTENCPITTVLELIGTKWKILIIRDLLDKKKRFGELKKSTGASQKVLTAHLREMEADGLILRKAYSEVPPKVEYSLTDLGVSLAPIVDTMAEWGSDYERYCALLAKKNS